MVRTSNDRKGDYSLQKQPTTLLGLNPKFPLAPSRQTLRAQLIRVKPVSAPVLTHCSRCLPASPIRRTGLVINPLEYELFEGALFRLYDRGDNGLGRRAVQNRQRLRMKPLID